MALKILVTDMHGTLTHPIPMANHCMGTMTKNDILKVMDPVVIARLEPRQEIIDRVNGYYDDGHMVYVITGAWDYLEEITKSWLMFHKVKWHALAMRPHHRFEEPSVKVKIDGLNDILEASANFSSKPEIRWLDDDISMVEHVRKLGYEAELV